MSRAEILEGVFVAGSILAGMTGNSLQKGLQLAQWERRVEVELIATQGALWHAPLSWSRGESRDPVCTLEQIPSLSLHR